MKICTIAAFHQTSNKSENCGQLIWPHPCQFFPKNNVNYSPLVGKTKNIEEKEENWLYPNISPKGAHYYYDKKWIYNKTVYVKN